MGKRLELINRKFGRLKVLKFSHVKEKNSYWHVKCVCGNEKIIMGGSLIKGASKSCGCLSKQLTSKRSKTHGKRKSREYNSWAHMKWRCLNPNSGIYKYYGKRKIKICKRWLNSFKNFYEDMGKRPKGKSLDRINNNGNYCKKNCRWATHKQQMNNRSI